MSLHVDSAASRVCSGDIKDAGTPAGPGTSRGGSELPGAQGPHGGEGKEAISGLCGVEYKLWCVDIDLYQREIT